MNASRNAANLAVLFLWAVLGAVFTLHTVFVKFAPLPALSWWLWFLGFAAVMMWLSAKVKQATTVLVLHALAFVVLHLIPRVFPLSLLRLGLDLLGSIT